MTEQKSRPAGNGTAEVLAGELNYDNSNAYPPIIRLTNAAESYIAQLAVDLTLSNVASHQLSPALAEFYWLAYFAGHDTHDADCAAEIERLRWERDLWYYCANNRGKRPSDFYKHLTDELWQGAAS